MENIDRLYKKYKNPVKMIHYLTSGKTKYSQSMISHMIATILDKYPISNTKKSKTLKHSLNTSLVPIPNSTSIPAQPPPSKSSTKKVKRAPSFFSKLFI